MIRHLRDHGRALALALLTASLLLGALEWVRPYYFLQDDGLEYFLPAYAHNLRSVASGEFPFYNFHTFGGIPHASLGNPGPFYAPGYLALLASRAVWGHFFAAIDLLAVMHILIAVAGACLLLRRFRCGEVVSAFGALTSMSGYCIWTGRMWPIALMLCAWFPWMLLAAVRFAEKPSAGGAAWLMAFRLALLYGGYPQFFILAMIFEHLFVLGHSLLLRDDGRVRRYFTYLTVNVPTALLGLPMMLPIGAEASRSLERATPMPFWEFSSIHMTARYWLHGQFFVHMPLLVQGGIDRSLPYLSHIGILPTLLSALVLLQFWKLREHWRWLLVSAACCAVALLWACGKFDAVLYELPLLNRFRWPFKLLYFALFFQGIAAAVPLARAGKRWQYVAIATFAVNWIFIFCFLPSRDWREIEYHPPLKSAWADRVRDGRYLVLSHDLLWFSSNEYMGQNYSMLWNADNLLGYEPMLARLSARVGFGNTPRDLHTGAFENPADAQLFARLKQLSVRYILLSPNRGADAPQLTAAGFRKLATERGWTFWEDPAALSRVRWDDAQGVTRDAGIRWNQHVNSIDVTLDQWPARKMTFAYVGNPDLQVCKDSRCYGVVQSVDGLVHVDVPPGTRQVRLVYRNQIMMQSLTISAATLVVLLVAAALWRYGPWWSDDVNAAAASAVGSAR